MDQCSRHDTPSVLSATLTNQPGHGLIAEIDSLNVRVLTGRRLGHHTATDKRSPRDVPPLECSQANGLTPPIAGIVWVIGCSILPAASGSSSGVRPSVWTGFFNGLASQREGAPPYGYSQGYSQMRHSGRQQLSDQVLLVMQRVPVHLRHSLPVHGAFLTPRFAPWSRIGHERPSCVPGCGRGESHRGRNGLAAINRSANVDANSTRRWRSQRTGDWAGDDRSPVQ